MTNSHDELKEVTVGTKSRWYPFKSYRDFLHEMSMFDIMACAELCAISPVMNGSLAAKAARDKKKKKRRTRRRS